MGTKSLTALVAAVASASAMAAAGVVGLPLDAVTVPIEKVTVAESQVRAPSYAERCQTALNGKTEDERLAAIDYVYDGETLVKVIRTDKSAAVRRAAFAKLVEDDLIFRMIFKPGVSGGVADVRLDAVESVAEVEVAKWLVARCSDAKVKQAASSRLSKVFATEKDRTADAQHPVVRSYIQRTANR